MHSGVMETQALLGEYVQSRMSEVGRQRAIASAADGLGWTTRRVLAFLHGEVRRVWHDEVVAARRWHDDWSEQESRRLEAKAALMRTRREARQMGNDAGSAESGCGQVCQVAVGRVGEAGGQGGQHVPQVAGTVREAAEATRQVAAGGGRL